MSVALVYTAFRKMRERERERKRESIAPIPVEPGIRSQGEGSVASYW